MFSLKYFLFLMCFFLIGSFDTVFVITNLYGIEFGGVVVSTVMFKRVLVGSTTPLFDCFFEW